MLTTCSTPRASSRPRCRRHPTSDPAFPSREGRHSLINRFLGCFRMKLYSQTIHFVVVSSVFAAATRAEVAAPALATMDGSLHTLPSKPAAGLDDMDGSLYNLRAFG